MSEDDQVDWQMLMRFGLGVLGLAPRDFWAMSPHELTASAEGKLGVLSRAAPMNSASLSALMSQHPDEVPPKGGCSDDR